MTVGPLGNTAGLSGSQNDAASGLRRTQSEQKAQKAEGLGATDADQETSERDADGRRLWEVAEDGELDANEEQPAEDRETTSQPTAKDPTGNSGGLLDLMG